MRELVTEDKAIAIPMKNFADKIRAIAAKAERIVKIGQWLVDSLKKFPDV